MTTLHWLEYKSVTMNGKTSSAAELRLKPHYCVVQYILTDITNQFVLKNQSFGEATMLPDRFSRQMHISQQNL